MRWTQIWTRKIANVTYCGHFGPKTAHLAMIAGFGENYQFWSQNDHNMLHFRFFKLIFVFSASKYIGYDVKIVIFWKFIFDILSIRSCSIEFSFALCIAQTLIKFKIISYTYSILLNPLAAGCPGGAAKIRGKWCTLTTAMHRRWASACSIEKAHRRIPTVGHAETTAIISSAGISGPFLPVWSCYNAFVKSK